jgi:Tfp pilus assembly protein PilF
MSMRPKTKQRMLILALFAALILAAGAGLYRWRIHLANLKIDAYKETGMAAFHAGDYPTAIENLSIYCTKRKTDPDALMAFAIARSKVPTLDGSHIVQAVTLARHYCDLEPDDVEAQHFLIELEAPLNLYAAAALDQARDLLKQNPADLTALKAIAQIQTRERDFDEAFDAAQRYCAVNPTDLEMQQVSLYLMEHLNRPPAEILDYADALQKKYPNDPRFLIVEVLAYSVTINSADTSDQRAADEQAAMKLLLQAAQQDPPDTQYVIFTTKLLDQTRHYAESLELLTRAATKLNDPTLLPGVAQRLFQNHQFQKVVDLLPEVDPASAASEKTNADLVAFKAMSLYELNRKTEASALIDALSGRTNEPSADSWFITLQTVCTDVNLPLKTRLENFQEALQHSPGNPVISYLLGETYLRMGENSLAMENWRTAAARAPSWAEPQVRIAEVLASEGRPDAEASSAAQHALSAGLLAPGQRETQAVTAQILVDYSQWESSHDPQQAQDLITRIAEVQKLIPNEPETLPVYVDLLARTGNHDQAVAVIRGAENSTGPYREDLLLRLARISRDQQLHMESELYATIQKDVGLTPELALAQAGDLLSAGSAAEGLQLIQSAQTKGNAAGIGTPVQWDLVLCQYREISGDPAAPAAWQALGDAQPDDLLVQSKILADENSAWSNRPFIDRSINRLKDITGDDAIGWKVYRARWLVDGDDSQTDAAAAVVLLTDVLKVTSTEVGPHILMAMAYDKLQNYPAAIAEWRQAADLQPGSGTVLWGLLSSLDMDNQPDEARLAFDRLANVPDLKPDLALKASLLMAREGDLPRAQRLLTAYPTASNQVLHDATLAKVDRMLGQINDAATYYFKVAQAPSLDAATIRDAADFFGSQHDLPPARQFLARLDDLNLPNGQAQLILADFEDAYGDPAAAANLYAQAVKNGGNQPDSAKAQIGYLIRHHQWSAAATALNLATAQWSNDADLSSLHNINQTLSAAPRIADQAPDLVNAATRDPADPAVAATLAAVAAGGQDADATAQTMSDLVQKYPRFFPVYELAVQSLIADRRMDDAVTLAANAMVQFPDSADAAKLSAQAYAAVGRWGDCILAATKWRQRGADNPQEADIMIAIADLFSDQAQDAVNRLAPYIPDAKNSPDVYEDILVTYAEALIRSGDEADAASLLHPLAEKSTKWRADWLKIAAISHPDAPSALAWINQIRPLFDPNSVDDQTKIAAAYFDVAIHLNDPKAFQMARDALSPFVDSPNATVPALMTYALACSAGGDDAAAEHAYRQLLKIDPKQPVAENNLADILRKKSTPDAWSEAEALARAAIAAEPNSPDASNFYDTLARTLLSEGKSDDAIAAFQQGEQLQPRNFSILIGLASAFAHANRMDDAAHYLNKIDSLLPPNAQLPPDSQAELDAARDLVKKSSPSSAATP